MVYISGKQIIKYAFFASQYTTRTLSYKDVIILCRLIAFNLPHYEIVVNLSDEESKRFFNSCTDSILKLDGNYLFYGKEITNDEIFELSYQYIDDLNIVDGILMSLYHFSYYLTNPNSNTYKVYGVNNLFIK